MPRPAFLSHGVGDAPLFLRKEYVGCMPGLLFTNSGIFVFKTEGSPCHNLLKFFRKKHNDKEKQFVI